MSRLRKYYPFLVIGIYLTCILIADPRGNFPLNDDWSYARSAFSFASGRGIRVDQWSAPSLIGQAFYGGLLTKIVRPDFLVLRISTLFLSCCTAFLLWSSLLRMGVRKHLACIVLLAWIFNPLQFSLSFTFMTEIPFLFFAALAFYLYTVHLDTRKPMALILCAAVLGYAYLVRQSALLFAIALACSLLSDSRKTISERVRQVLLVSGTSGTFIAGYYWWTLAQGRTTAAVQRKFELLQQLTTKQLAGNSYGLLFYLAFMLIPVWIYLVPSGYRFIRSHRRTVRATVLLAWCAIVGTGLWWFHVRYTPAEYLPSTAYHSRMPFLLNVLYDSGLGPITLDPVYYGTPPTPVYPRIWQSITAIVAFGAIMLGSLCVLGLARLRGLAGYGKHKPLIVFAGLSLFCLALFEIVFSHLQEGGLFDRHVLIVSFPLYLLLAICFRDEGDVAQAASRFRFALPGIAIAVLMAFCVAATHDYMSWNRIRWDIGRSLLKEGVDPLSIVGGFEFNAWNNYDTFVARGNIERIHHWWYDRQDYVISMTPLDDYRIRQTKTYYSWVHHRPVNLYLLRKSS